MILTFLSPTALTLALGILANNGLVPVRGVALADMGVVNTVLADTVEASSSNSDHGSGAAKDCPYCAEGPCDVCYESYLRYEDDFQEQGSATETVTDAQSNADEADLAAAVHASQVSEPRPPEPVDTEDLPADESSDEGVEIDHSDVSSQESAEIDGSDASSYDSDYLTHDNSVDDHSSDESDGDHAYGEEYPYGQSYDNYDGYDYENENDYEYDYSASEGEDRQSGADEGQDDESADDVTEDESSSDDVDDGTNDDSSNDYDGYDYQTDGYGYGYDGYENDGEYGDSYQDESYRDPSSAAATGDEGEAANDGTNADAEETSASDTDTLPNEDVDALDLNNREVYGDYEYDAEADYEPYGDDSEDSANATGDDSQQLPSAVRKRAVATLTRWASEAGHWMGERGRMSVATIRSMWNDYSVRLPQVSGVAASSDGRWIGCEHCPPGANSMDVTPAYVKGLSEPLDDGQRPAESAPTAAAVRPTLRLAARMLSNLGNAAINLSVTLDRMADEPSIPVADRR